MMDPEVHTLCVVGLRGPPCTMELHTCCDSLQTHVQRCAQGRQCCFRRACRSKQNRRQRPRLLAAGKVPAGQVCAPATCALAFARMPALNAPIQGSAADIIKVAMLKVVQGIKSDGLKSRLLLQVHDELIFEIFPGEEKQLETLVCKEMEGAVELSLPLAVNVGIGASWYLAAH